MGGLSAWLLLRQMRERHSSMGYGMHTFPRNFKCAEEGEVAAGVQDFLPQVQSCLGARSQTRCPSILSSSTQSPATVSGISLHQDAGQGNSCRVNTCDFLLPLLSEVLVNLGNG